MVSLSPSPGGPEQGCHGCCHGGGNGYSVLLAVCSAICPAAFGHVLPICIGQNILMNESIFLCNSFCFSCEMVDIFHSITNEWAKFDTKDMIFFNFFSHALPTSMT